MANQLPKPMFRPDGRRGFTAIEIAMVATVIALLALIVLPLFRNRVEEAKIAAAKGDLASLMKAEQLAQADTGFYLRLEDLDNTKGNPYSDSANPNPPANGGIVLETPPFVFYAGNPPSSRAPLNLNQWRLLAGTSTDPKFKGPYTSFQRSATYEDVRLGRTALLPGSAVRSVSGNNQAPIWDVPEADAASPGIFDSDENRIPVDPWGNPYLFFPPTGETLYTNAVIYSMGPNGVPGNGAQVNSPNAYLKPDPATATNPEEWLGGHDDLMVQF